MSGGALLEIRDLSVVARSRGGEVQAVRHLDLTVHRGETVGVIGESGSGKSTTVAAVLDLLGPNRHVRGGTIAFDGRVVYGDGADRRQSLRGRDVGFVFQAAATSLNPMRRVRSQLGELLQLHLGLRGAAATRRMHELLEHLGFDDPDRVLRSYPHQLSGGMAQRVAIAMALAGEPSLLVADEATSALDVITQASVVRLLRRLSEQDGYAILFVTHDIALAAEMCDVLVVLQQGVAVEAGPVAQVVGSPEHPYTRSLIEAVVVALERDRPPSDELDAAGVRRVHGRGVETFRWAAQLLVAQVRSPAARHAYGDHPDQVAELRLPPGDGPHPVVVLVHGGYWRSYWALDLMDDLAVHLAARGYATWNLEYRRGEGAVLDALDDVAAGVDHLRTLGLAVDLARVGLVGHSAGGQLVLWLAGRRAHGEPGALVPTVCVPLAPVADVAGCARRGLGEDAARQFLGGGPGDVPARYQRADPAVRLPVGAPVTIVQGLADAPDLIDLTRGYARASAAHSDELTVLELPDADHFHVIDPATAAWAAAEGALDAHLHPDPGAGR